MFQSSFTGQIDARFMLAVGELCALRGLQPETSITYRRVGASRAWV